MTGSRTDMGEAEFLQQLPDIARMKVDAEPLGDDMLEVDPPPPDDAPDAADDVPGGWDERWPRGPRNGPRASSRSNRLRSLPTLELSCHGTLVTITPGS